MRAFLSCSTANEMIKQQGGNIINIASCLARKVFPVFDYPDYHAAKAGVVQLTRALASKWGEHGIRVNSISPGHIKHTDVAQPHFDDPEQLEERVKRTPLNRYGCPVDLQGAAVFLASPASSFVTGHDLVVDGGYTL